MIKLFGTTIKESIASFQELHLGADRKESSKDDKIKTIGRIVVTIILILVAAYCLVSGIQKELWGSLLGAIAGYWLR